MDKEHSYTVRFAHPPNPLQLIIFWVAVFYVGVGLGIFTPKRSKGLERRNTSSLTNVLEKIFKGGKAGKIGAGMLGSGGGANFVGKKKQF